MRNLFKTTLAIALAVSSFSAMADNETDRIISAQISAQHPQHQVMAKSEYQTVREQLDSTLAKLQQTKDTATFNALAQEGRDLALRARSLVPSKFTNMYEAKENQRELGRLYYEQYYLGKLADKLEQESHQTAEQFTSAQSIQNDVNM